MLSSLALLLWLAAPPDQAPFAVPEPEPTGDVTPARTPRGFVLRLDAGAFLGSGWGTQSYRQQLNALQEQGQSYLTNRAAGGEVDSFLFVRTTLPVAGPLLTLQYGGELARREAAELVLTSVLQAVGLALLTYQAFTRHEAPEPPAALELSISPLVAGHLGLSLTLSF